MPERPRMRAQAAPSAQASFEELEAGLQIDLNRLQVCCLHQSELFYQVSKQAAQTRSERDKAKKDINEVEARLKTELRSVAERHGDKITVDELNMNVILHPQMQRAQASKLELEAKLGELEALQTSYDHRRSMLKELVSLHLSNYYSDPVRSAEVRANRGETATDRLRRERQERNAERHRRDFRG
jgi:hypothetical protein